jgi:uncharacterized coiled-coil protein SlyX
VPGKTPEKDVFRWVVAWFRRSGYHAFGEVAFVEQADMREDAQQIIRMQERITYLEKTVEDLSEVLVGLQDRLARQERILRDFGSQQELDTSGSRLEDSDEVPPHYGLPRSLPPGFGRDPGK